MSQADAAAQAISEERPSIDIVAGVRAAKAIAAADAKRAAGEGATTKAGKGKKEVIHQLIYFYARDPNLLEHTGQNNSHSLPPCFYSWQHQPARHGFIFTHVLFHSHIL